MKYTESKFEQSFIELLQGEAYKLTAQKDGTKDFEPKSIGEITGIS